jgi:hypothetical protein
VSALVKSFFPQRAAYVPISLKKYPRKAADWPQGRPDALGDFRGDLFRRSLDHVIQADTAQRAPEFLLGN